MGITNVGTHVSHGNSAGRRAVLDIIEAGLQAADPYDKVRRLVRVERGRLVVGCPDFVPLGSPVTGTETFDLDALGRVYVFGAGKGIQRAALAIEDVLGDRLTGGQVIDKKGGNVLLKRIGVTLGGHPLPDDDCVRGCRCIMEMTRGLRRDDLVFTLGASGFSSLLTLPVPGVTLGDVRATVHLMQIERGAPTNDLSPIRNHLDLLKGGRISARLDPAHAIHIVAKDPGSYEALMHENTWIHTLPDHSTFADAIHNLKKWGAWDDVPDSVREYLQRADPAHETIKPDAYQRLSHRIYGVLPGQQGHWPAPRAKAEELGYRAVSLAMGLHTEACHAGAVIATIAKTIEAHSVPFESPVALLTAGELLVTVGKETGIGGRNQEFALSAALEIAGSRRIVIGAVDTDGTDGPGDMHSTGHSRLPTLAGGIVDGHSVREAQDKGLDLRSAIQRHDATPALLALDSGILATQSTGLQDLGVVLVDHVGS